MVLVNVTRNHLSQALYPRTIMLKFCPFVFIILFIILSAITVSTTLVIILNLLTKEICYLLTYLLTCITLEDFLNVSLEFYSVIYLSFYFFDCSILETHSLFKCHLRTGPHFLAISGTCMGKGSELDLPCSLLFQFTVRYR